MKRILALMFSLILILPLAACSSSLASEETLAAETLTAEKKTEKKEDDPYAIPKIPFLCPRATA